VAQNVERAISNYPKTGCNPSKIQDLRAFSDSYLGNRRPIDLMGTDEEEKVFDLLHAVDQGLF
jgi:hypothetical protein